MGRTTGRYGTERKTGARVLPAFDPAPSGAFAASVLKDAKAPGALIGRLAVWAWLPDSSQHEFTKDLDVAIPPGHAAAIRDEIERRGVATRPLPIGGVNASDESAGIKVDFIERTSPDYGDLSGLFRAAVRAAQSTVQVGAVTLRLVPAEYLVVMKIATGEDKDERDAERLLLHAEPPPDVEAVRKLVKRHLGVGSVSRLEALLNRIGHSASRKSRYGDEGPKA